MKRDISIPPVRQVAVAVVPRADQNDPLWDIHLVNLGQDPMENILVTSQGYGMLDGRDKTTTVLRHFHQLLRAGESILIEPIEISLFGITNEYWVSFNQNGNMLDKKYVFKAGEIGKDALENVPVLNRPGVFKQ